MTRRKENVMGFKSQLPALVGKKQHEENRVVGAAEIAEATKLSRQTIYTWLKSDVVFDTLDADTADAFCKFFDATLNDIVEIVKKPGRGE